MFPTVDSEGIEQNTSLASKPITASDAGNSTENSRGIQTSTQPNNREITFNMLIKEMLFCIALALTTYGALHNTPTKVSKHPQAVRFFRPDSLVTDWHRGQLISALSVINKMDVSFVMYYAPWDAESQYVRGDFEKAARIMKDRVYFAAINCWNPGSECRLQHNKIPSWPILMAYTINSRGVLYKGLKDAYSMVNFLELMLKPLRRISSTEELVNLLSMCDAVAVGYTPLVDTSKFYNIWYNVALKSHEFDTIGEICFAVVTSEELARDLGVEILPNARLMLWNDTKEYTTGENSVQKWNESMLMHWVLENFSQPVARIIPLWKKSFTFDRYIDGNPILILFSPLNPLYEQLPAYALLREVAMEYYNCKNNDSSQWTSELIKLQRVQRRLYQQNNYTRFCERYKFKKVAIKKSRFFKKEVEAHNNKYPWNNTTYKSNKNSFTNFLLKRGLLLSDGLENAKDNSQLLSSLGFLEECSLNTLPAQRVFYDKYEQCLTYQAFLDNENEEDIEQESETSMLPYEDDHLSPDNLVQSNVKHFCTIMKFAHERNRPVLPSLVHDKKGNVSLIEGLSCANNFSLHILAMDSVHNRHFAESLGIDIVNKKDMTAVAILDNEHECQYVLSEEYSASSVRNFIYNYTMKRLNRSLRTHVAGATRTHYYNSNGTLENIDSDNSSVYVIDLTTKTFQKVVKTPGTEVTVVLVCGGACGARVSGALVRASRAIRASGVRVRTARIDARAHDLQWPYAVPKYPALLVFPAHSDGEAESRSYPVDEQITTSGIVSLTLRSLSAPQNMRVRLALCASVQAQIEKKKCLKDIREHITAVIGRNLKYWRRTDSKKLKDALVIRLQHLHQVSLKLSVINLRDLYENSDKQVSLLNSLATLSKHWSIDPSVLRRNVTSSLQGS